MSMYHTDRTKVDPLPQLPDWQDPAQVAKFLTSLPDRNSDCPAASSELIKTVGLTFHLLRGDILITSVPVAGNRQIMGFIHGGANAVIGETTGSVAGGYQAPPGQSVVGMNIIVTHHRPVSSGRVYCVAKLLHQGRTLATYELLLFNEQGKLSASGSHTVAFIQVEDE